MRPATFVLLHSPLTTAAAWGAVPDRLAERGFAVVVPEVADDDRPPYAGRYVARAALEINAARPDPPLVLVGHGGAGPLVPAVGGAQRAAHRLVGGYVFLDALLPRAGTATRLDLLRAEDPDAAGGIAALLEGGGRYPDRAVADAPPGAIRPRGRDFFTEPLPMAQDWPNAPCGYLRTSALYAGAARQARLRGWPVRELEAGHFAAYHDPSGVAQAICDLLEQI